MKKCILLFFIMIANSMFASSYTDPYKSLCGHINLFSPGYCDLNDYALINSFIVASEMVDSNDAVVRIKMNSEQSEFDLSDTNIRKALSMAILRSISVSSTLFVDNGIKIELTDEIWVNARLSSWNFLMTSVENMVCCIKYSGLAENIFKDENGVPTSVYSDGVWMNFYGNRYSKELAGIIRTISKIKNKEAKNENSVFDFYKNHLKECSPEELAAKYDFYQNMKGKCIELQAGMLGSDRLGIKKKDGGKPLILSGVRNNAFLIALMRLKLSADELDDVYHPYLAKYKTLNGPVTELQLKLADGSRYLLYIKAGKRNIVGIHLIESSNEETKAGMPSDGVYYSPELYRMIITAFSDMVYKEYLGKYSN